MAIVELYLFRKFTVRLKLFGDDAFSNIPLCVIEILQEDFNDVDGSAPVTSQPAPGQGTSSNVTIPMPGPNPTNPFASANEQTSLNSSEQATYTPGK